MVGKSVSICKASVVPFWMNLAIHLPSSPTLHHLFPHHLVMWGPETPRRKMVLWSHTEKQEYSCPLGFFFTGWCATRSWDYWVQGQADSLARRIAVIKEPNQNLFVSPKKDNLQKMLSLSPHGHKTPETRTYSWTWGRSRALWQRGFSAMKITPSSLWPYF